MKRTLVLGASLNPSRYANLVTHRLLAKGEEVYAVGNRAGSIAGLHISTQKIMIQDLDTITLYLNPKRQKEYYNYIIALQPKRVIFNPGSENPELYKLLDDNEIPYELACTLVLLGTNQY